MSSRVVVIGGDAAGMTAASALRRRLRAGDEVIVLERGSWTSYSACGIPYWIAGSVESAEALVVRTPEEHRKNGIDLRLETEVVAIDPVARTVSIRDGEAPIAYDRLLIATGAEPTRPDLPGIDGAGIHGVQTLADGQALIDALATGPHHVVVVGSGYIGLEIAEACVERGFATTVIERGATPLSIVEPALGEQIAGAMRSKGIALLVDTAVTGFALEQGRVVGVRTEESVIDADLVILGLGVSARSALAADAGLPLGAKGGIVVDEHQRVEGFDGIWAAGDCVVTTDRVTGARVHLPLGTHANKQGMVVGDSIAADLLGEEPRLSFPGVVGTAITKFCALEISRTGLGEEQARAAGFDPVVVSIETTNFAGYMPDPGAITVVMIADRASRRLLGAQIVGAEDAALRIDVAGTALAAGLTVDEIVMLDLAYAPPFSSVWSPIQVAARAAVKELGY